MSEVMQDVQENDEELPVASGSNQWPDRDNILMLPIHEEQQRISEWLDNWEIAMNDKDEKLSTQKAQLDEYKEILRLSELDKVSLETALNEEIQNRETICAKIADLHQILDDVMEDQELLADVTQRYEIGRETAEDHFGLQLKNFEAVLSKYENIKRNHNSDIACLEFRLLSAEKRAAEKEISVQKQTQKNDDYRQQLKDSSTTFVRISEEFTIKDSQLNSVVEESSRRRAAVALKHKLTEARGCEATKLTDRVEQKKIVMNEKRNDVDLMRKRQSSLKEDIACARLSRADRIAKHDCLEQSIENDIAGLKAICGDSHRQALEMDFLVEKLESDIRSITNAKLPKPVRAPPLKRAFSISSTESDYMDMSEHGCSPNSVEVRAARLGVRTEYDGSQTKKTASTVKPPSASTRDIANSQSHSQEQMPAPNNSVRQREARCRGRPAKTGDAGRSKLTEL